MDALVTEKKKNQNNFSSRNFSCTPQANHQPMESDERKAKVEIKYSPGNPNSATFIFHGEDHTIGNPLRYICIRNPDVGFCGYSVPHPSDDAMNLRIQMKDPNGDPIAAVRKGFSDLSDIGTHMLLTFENQVALFTAGLQDEEMQV